MEKCSYQENFSNIHPDEMFNVEKRRLKAQKVISVLRVEVGDLGALRHLDLGCSTGLMTRMYSDYFESTIGVDIDQNGIEYAKKYFGDKSNLLFFQRDAMDTALDSDSFDVVTCTHIYEHVPSAVKLVDEIYRVLKPSGICFFSAGNRLNLIEPHYKLPMLSIIPKVFAHYYMRLFKKGDYYYENHLTYWQLLKLVRKFQLRDYTTAVVEDPKKFFATDMILPGTTKQKLILALLKTAYFLCPTYIWILQKPKELKMEDTRNENWK